MSYPARAEGLGKYDTYRKGMDCYSQAINHMEIWSLWWNKIRIVSSCSHVSTTVWLNHMEFNETVERYYCKLNFQSKSSKLSKANISFVVRVGVNNNVTLILIFTFKAASVSSAILLSLLRTCHTRDNNRIQWSPPILVSHLSLLPQSNPLLLSQRPPHLHTSSDNLCDFTRSDGYKKSQAPSWISLFPTLSLNDAHAKSLKRYPPLRFHDFCHKTFREKAR